MNFTEGLFEYFDTFMDTLIKMSDIFTQTFRDVIVNESSFISDILGIFDITVDMIPAGILDIPLAVFIFGGTLVGVMIFNVVKWVLPII